MGEAPLRSLNAIVCARTAGDDSDWDDEYGEAGGIGPLTLGMVCKIAEVVAKAAVCATSDSLCRPVSMSPLERQLYIAARELRTSALIEACASNGDYSFQYLGAKWACVEALIAEVAPHYKPSPTAASAAIGLQASVVIGLFALRNGKLAPRRQGTVRASFLC